ncbi:hypothetical protein CCMA1212_010026 [Trichoderma ghanense]|uniref:Uncharacterized protein n=1 Tax=Trichoderma ghanense TaxID=65468 RepID=A0ABY2GQI6_9HYPO
MQVTRSPRVLRSYGASVSKELPETRRSIKAYQAGGRGNNALSDTCRAVSRSCNEAVCDQDVTVPEITPPETRM